MMSRRWLALGVACLLGVSACGPESNAPLSPDSDTEALLKVTNRGGATIDVIVILNESFAPGGHEANRAAADRIGRGLGLTPKLTYGTAAFGFSATIPEARLNGLQRNPQIKYVEIDRIASIPRPVTQAPKFCSNPANADHPACAPDSGSEADPVTGNQTIPWGIARVGGPKNGTGKTAWIIDTGIDFNHPDLNVDESRSKSFVLRGKKSAKDGHGHGTHVAGTIAALDNLIDVVGVAAGATVVAVRVLDNSGSGYYSWVIAGIDYVADNGSAGDVANMSLGGPKSDAVDDAVVAAASNGIMFSLAAGNSSADANNYSPARAEGPGVFTISAIGEDNCLASFSNFGSTIEFAAPGVGVLSTKKGGGTTTFSGTSMAAPHVAGLLLWGNVRTDGYICGDKDDNPDPIAHI